MTQCLKVWVTGRVQGVGFRYYTQIKARSLGLNGYAKNLPDGRVEIVCSGVSEQVDKMVDWLSHGPPMAKVTGVEVAACDNEWHHSGFFTG